MLLSRASPVAHWLSSHVLLRQPGVRWFGSRVQTYTLLVRPAVAGIAHIKKEEDGHGC